MEFGRDGGRRLTLACGIDLGSLRTPAYVAWLAEDLSFKLDAYVPSPEQPLPAPPPEAGGAGCYAIDGPQGLPRRGSAARQADLMAQTPVRRLPAGRRELASWPLYRGLIEAGIELFWAVYEKRLGGIPGLAGGLPRPLVCETYPRFILRRLWSSAEVPPKRRQPVQYADFVWGRLRALGYRCDGVIRPTPDQADAMLCALAAWACAQGGREAYITLGEPPTADAGERVLREGYIVVPAGHPG